MKIESGDWVITTGTSLYNNGFLIGTECKVIETNHTNDTYKVAVKFENWFTYEKENLTLTKKSIRRKKIISIFE
jgi:hypothetical protein